MKTALVTTTINVPTVLTLLSRQHMRYGRPENEVAFFVAGDLKTPPEAEVFCKTIPNCFYLSPKEQDEWQCSALISWNCIQRRNIAILEALKWGADIIVTIDDDNIPFARGGYLDTFANILTTPFDGLRVTGNIAHPSVPPWFDVGVLLDPVASHRGFPHDIRCEPIFKPVVNARIGVAAGICLGDPDISAVTRIARAPIVHRVSELLRGGIVVDPAVHTVWNTQNTALIRELAPAMLLPPQWSRYDDIWASLVCQWVMRPFGFCVHYGAPMVWQQRNEHDLVKDLQAELFGMQHILDFSNWLDAQPRKNTVLDSVASLYAGMSELSWMPLGVSELAQAWVDDCDKAMA